MSLIVCPYVSWKNESLIKLSTNIFDVDVVDDDAFIVTSLFVFVCFEMFFILKFVSTGNEYSKRLFMSKSNNFSLLSLNVTNKNLLYISTLLCVKHIKLHKQL